MGRSRNRKPLPPPTSPRRETADRRAAGAKKPLARARRQLCGTVAVVPELRHSGSRDFEPDASKTARTRRVDSADRIDDRSSGRTRSAAAEANRAGAPAAALAPAEIGRRETPGRAGASTRARSRRELRGRSRPSGGRRGLGCAAGGHFPPYAPRASFARRRRHRLRASSPPAGGRQSEDALDRCEPTQSPASCEPRSRPERPSATPARPRGRRQAPGSRFLPMDLPVQAGHGLGGSFWAASAQAALPGSRRSITDKRIGVMSGPRGCVEKRRDSWKATNRTGLGCR